MVLSPLQLYKYIIHIVFQLAMHHVMEYGGHRALVSCAYNFKPEGHYSVVEITYGFFESSFHCIFWHHLHLVISTESIL